MKYYNFANIFVNGGFAKDDASVNLIRPVAFYQREARSIKIKKKKKKTPTRLPFNPGCSRARSRFASFPWRYTGGRPEMLGGPSSGEPAGERTTCRRDRWGQTAVVHLLPSSSPLLYPRATRAPTFADTLLSLPPRRMVIPTFCASPPPPTGLARAVLTPRAWDRFLFEWISREERGKDKEKKMQMEFISILSSFVTWLR